jgi:hypothetical protein
MIHRWLRAPATKFDEENPFQSTAINQARRNPGYFFLIFCDGSATIGGPELSQKMPRKRTEARIGQKNGLVRQWARKGTRPRQPADQRYENAYLFGAICPAHGKGAALALPYADTEMMRLHLDEIATHVAPGAHAIRERLAIPASELALKPRLRDLRRYPRRRLRGLEQPHRSPRNHSIHRDAPLSSYRSMIEAVGIISCPAGAAAIEVCILDLAMSGDMKKRPRGGCRRPD